MMDKLRERFILLDALSKVVKMYVEKNGKWVETHNGFTFREIEFKGVCGKNG